MTSNAITESFPLRAEWAKAGMHAKDLIQWIPKISPHLNNLEVAACFHEAPEIDCFPVVEDGRPVGMIYRPTFMENFARPFVRELHGRKSCMIYADPSPLLIDAEMPLPYVGRLLATVRQSHARYGYLVTENGQYAGFCNSSDLMRALSDQELSRHRALLDSIEYASHIQRSFLRKSIEEAASCLGEHFIWWEPRDKVGGDCFVFRRVRDGYFLGVIDCTGHGVPGAFLTLIVMSSLDHVLETFPASEPDVLMAALNRTIKWRLSQGGVPEESATPLPEKVAGLLDDEAGRQSVSDDGFDGVLCWLSSGLERMVYASAKGLVMRHDPKAGAVDVLDGDRVGVGYRSTPSTRTWTRHMLDLQPGVGIYLSTDGLLDQIGGTRRIAFGKKRLAETLTRIAARPMSAQQGLIREKLMEYQGEEARRDDVTLIGFKVGSGALLGGSAE